MGGVPLSNGWSCVHFTIYDVRKKQHQEFMEPEEQQQGDKIRIFKTYESTTAVPGDVRVDEKQKQT